MTVITHLSIQGLAIIDQLEIDFAPGFNVITGETGAGKSILIRALNFLTGGKASPDAVRRGFEAATVVGEFEVPAEHPVHAALEELGLRVGEKREPFALLLRRQVHAKGRSQAWINDTPVAVHSLRAVGTALLDVFAQHENQRLLNPNAHTDYVDSFLSDSALREKVVALAGRCEDGIRALTEKLELLLKTVEQRDYLEFRKHELEKFAPSLEDHRNVQNYCDGAEKARRERDPLARALGLLEDSESGVSAAQSLRDAARALASLGEGFESLRDRLAQSAAEAEDISFELGKRLNAMELDEEALEVNQQRLFQYQEMFRKHGVKDAEGLEAQYQRLAAQMGEVENAEGSLNALLAQLDQDARALTRACAVLATARLQAAETIKTEVEKELSELHMPGAVFQAEFHAVKSPPAEIPTAVLSAEQNKAWLALQARLSGIGAGGSEKAEFHLSANPGEPPMPLAKVASGGELSRIMLALKKALAADADTCVLVFDEIDTGISGRVADVVGRKMAELSQRFQVLCISHLPQVAVHADAHFLVTKKGRGERTESSIVPLSREESAKEIARLLSGEDVSSSSLANAKSLIAVAHKRKKQTQGASVKP